MFPLQFLCIIKALKAIINVNKEQKINTSSKQICNIFNCFDTYVYISYKRKREKELLMKSVHSHLRKNKIRCNSPRFILNRGAERKRDEKQHKNSIKRNALFNGFKVDAFVIQNCHINKET